MGRTGPKSFPWTRRTCHRCFTAQWIGTIWRNGGDDPVDVLNKITIRQRKCDDVYRTMPSSLKALQGKQVD